jgi:outer membrane protein assembly factor BamB
MIGIWKFAALGAAMIVLWQGAPASADASLDWRQFRLDAQHTGFNRSETVLSQKNVRELGVAWEDQVGALVDYSSPVVANGRVFIGSTDGTLWAFKDRGCGQSLCTNPLWSSTSLGQIRDTPTVANGLVYVGSQTSFDDASGKLDVFAAKGCGHSQCAPLWRGVAGTQSILESSPTVANGIVFVGAFDGKLYAFPATGCGEALCQPLWTATTGGSIESTPTVNHGVVYVGSDDGKLYAISASGCGASSCAPLWTGDLGSAIFQSTPAIAKGLVYIAGQHTLAAFAIAGCGASTCKPVWQASDDGEFYNASPAIANGRLYIPWSTGLAVYDAKGCGRTNCEKLWILFGDGAQAAIISSPTVANGVVYAGRNTGEVLAWGAGPCGSDVCENLWSGMTGDPIVSSSPTVANGRLYIGSADDGGTPPQGRLYVFALP